jgi:hypothetical protein
VLTFKTNYYPDMIQNAAPDSNLHPQLDFVAVHKLRFYFALRVKTGHIDQTWWDCPPTWGESKIKPRMGFLQRKLFSCW